MGPPEATPRSWTAHDTEERTTGEGKFQLNVTIYTLPEPPFVRESTPPHKANYYKKSWYKVLAMFQYLQVLSVSGRVLIGAYINIGQPDFLYFFLNLLNWLTVYAPLSSFFMTLSYTIPAKLPAPFQKWLLSPNRHRVWTFTKHLIIFGIAEVFSLFTLFGEDFGLPWKNVIGDYSQFLPLVCLSGDIIVWVPWDITISLKLRRENGAS